MLLIESILALLTLLLAFAWPGLGASWFKKIERPLSRLANRRGLAVLVVGIAAFGLRVAVLPIEPIPVPGIHDEFGYLLSGDTFAHRRMTNPPHPMWIHFESMTIIQQPTYSSAFWPAQGLFLAFGKIFFGNFFWGVCLSFALMCAAFCWALQGWMPPGWAFLGGALAAMRLGVFTYWANSYWGGAVAALGGALVFGALPRIKRRQRVRDGVLMAAGLAILANSRPYEGLLYSIPFLFSLLLFLFSRRSGRIGFRVSRFVIPITAVAALTAAFMAYYFWRTTGDPLRPPYLVNTGTYFQEPQFIFQSLGAAKHYNHQLLQQFYGGYHVQMFLAAKHSPIVSAIGKLLYLFFFFVGPLLLLPFCVVVGVLPYGITVSALGSKTLFFLCVIAVTLFGLLLLPYLNPHYAAPMACAIYALVLQAMRRVRIWGSHGRKRGICFVRMTVASCVLVFVTSAVALAMKVPRSRLFPYDPYGPNIARSQVLGKLSRAADESLVIVHYGPGHDYHKEWVYNDADIDNSKVVWARDMGAQRNRELLNYFKDRQTWLLEADENPPRLVPYSEEEDDALANRAATMGSSEAK